MSYLKTQPTFQALANKESLKCGPQILINPFNHQNCH